MLIPWFSFSRDFLLPKGTPTCNKLSQDVLAIHGIKWSILQLRAWLPSLWTGVKLRATLLCYKHCCFSNVNFFIIILTRYWSLSQQRHHLQPHSKSKAWRLSTSNCEMDYCKQFHFLIEALEIDTIGAIYTFGLEQTRIYQTFIALFLSLLTVRQDIETREKW